MENDTCLLQKWQRINEIAEACDVAIELRSMIELTNKKGLFLGVFNTVNEAFAFLCGYEHNVGLARILKKDSNGKR